MKEFAEFGKGVQQLSLQTQWMDRQPTMSSRDFFFKKFLSSSVEGYDSATKTYWEAFFWNIQKLLVESITTKPALSKLKLDQSPPTQQQNNQYLINVCEKDGEKSSKLSRAGETTKKPFQS